jgi:hypothetical protein
MSKSITSGRSPATRASIASSQRSYWWTHLMSF